MDKLVEVNSRFGPEDPRKIQLLSVNRLECWWSSWLQIAPTAKRIKDPLDDMLFCWQIVIQPVQAPPTGFYSVNGQMLLASRKANLFSPCQTVCWPRNDTLGPFDQSTYDPLWSKGNQPQPENGNNGLFAGQSGQYNLCGVILIIWHIVDSHFCLFLPVGKTWHKSPNRKWAWPLRFDE